MYCRNCKTNEAKRLTIVADDQGRPFEFCDLCPRPEVERMNFPAIITNKRGMGRPRKIENNGDNVNGDKLNQYALSPEQIQNSQVLKTETVFVDTPQKRYLDNEIPRKEGKRVAVYVGGSSFGRESLLKKKAMAQLKTDDIRKIYDNGIKAMFEVNH